MSAPGSIVPAIEACSLRFFAVIEIAARPVRVTSRSSALGLGLLLVGQAVAGRDRR